MTNYLTVKQVKNACSNNDYLLMTFPSGYKMGVNCKISDVILNKRKYKNNCKTSYIGFEPCNLNTYINFKHKFI